MAWPEAIAKLDQDHCVKPVGCAGVAPGGAQHTPHMPWPMFCHCRGTTVCNGQQLSAPPHVVADPKIPQTPIAKSSHLQDSSGAVEKAKACTRACMAEGHHKRHVKEGNSPGMEQPGCSNHHCSTFFVVQTFVQEPRQSQFVLEDKGISRL